jgi:CHAT domain-containing protein
LKEVREALPEGDALIEFLVADDFVAAWVLRRDRARFVELGCSGREVASWVEHLQRPLADLRAGRTDVASLAFDVDAAHSLYGALVAPLQELLGSSELVWIVADGPLWGAPFGAFVVDYEKRAVDPARLYSQYAGCRFWIEEAALALAPSASFLARGSRSGGDAPDGWALGAFDPQPLPVDAELLRAARQELQSVRGRFQHPAPRLLQGAEATEARFKSELGSATWIHVAAHGYLDDERPEYSRIALAPAADGSEDGWLHAFEIEARTIRASSVVLTACETAGSSLRAEGLLGLARAFLAAGAGSVVASRWLVDDSSAALLVDRYYAALGRGERPPVALRSAQRTVLRDGGRPGVAYVHPFFWAGYVHFGGG